MSSSRRLARSRSESGGNVVNDRPVDTMEAWWEDFLRHQKEDAAESSALELEDLRRVFETERRVLERIFEPVRELMVETLREDRLSKGQRLYDEWGKMRRKECLLSYYDNDYFRAMYARQRFINSATSFMQALHLRIIPETPDVKNFLSQVTRVVSVGVGPGSDVAAFLAYARTRGMKQRIVYFTLDQCTQWSKYIDALDKKWASEYNVSLWFKQARFGKRDTVDLLPDADMLVFSFANTSLMDPQIWPLLQKRFPLIIVLDGIKEVLIDGFGDSSFIKFQLNEKTNVYYTFRGNDKVDSPVVDSSGLPDPQPAVEKQTQDSEAVESGSTQQEGHVENCESSVNPELDP